MGGSGQIRQQTWNTDSAFGVFSLFLIKGTPPLNPEWQAGAKDVFQDPRPDRGSRCAGLRPD